MIAIVQAIVTVALFGITSYFITLLAGLVAAAATWVCAIKGANATTTVVATIAVGAAAAAVMGAFVPFVASVGAGYVALACKFVSAKMVRVSN